MLQNERQVLIEFYKFHYMFYTYVATVHEHTHRETLMRLHLFVISTYLYLTYRVLDTEVEYQATKAEAERAEKLATEVRGESLSIYSDVKLLTIPDIDTEKLYDQASEIKSDVGIGEVFIEGYIIILRYIILPDFLGPMLTKYTE